MNETIVVSSATFRVRVIKGGCVIEKCHPLTHTWTFVDLCADAPAALAFYTFLITHAE